MEKMNEVGFVNSPVSPKNLSEFVCKFARDGCTTSSIRQRDNNRRGNPGHPKELMSQRQKVRQKKIVRKDYHTISFLICFSRSLNN